MLPTIGLRPSQFPQTAIVKASQGTKQSWPVYNSKCDIVDEWRDQC